MVPNFRKLATLLSVTAALAAGCTDQGPEPSGIIALKVVTTGNPIDIPLGGYLVRLDGAAPRILRIGAQGQVQYIPVSSGQHVVAIDGLPLNCSATEGTERSVDVSSSKTTEVSFTVACTPNTGTVQFTTVTTGTDPDPDGYAVHFPGLPTVELPANGSITVTDIRAGIYQVTLSGMSGNCAPSGSSQQTLNLSYRGTASLSFAVQCVTSGRLVINTTTTGADLDADGYSIELRREGSLTPIQIALPSNGSMMISGMLPATYSVTLSGFASNCVRNPAAVPSVAVEASSEARLDLNVQCMPSPTLAFVSAAGTARSISVVKSSGADFTRVTPANESNFDPSWSPDGKRLSFTSQRDSTAEIYVMDADGSNVTRLTSQNGQNYRPAWSPNGQRIAFVSTRDNNDEIYIMNADGSNPVRLTNHAAIDSDPAWSPDGARIAFRSSREGTSKIFIINADGSDPHAIADNANSDTGPAWSPDGTRIAFSRTTGSATRDIFVVPAAGGTVIQLTQGFSDAMDPSWSPDGRLVAFSNTPGNCSYYWYYYYDCPSEITIVSLDGARYTIPNLAGASDPTWRP
jgi:TolB protein